MVYFDSSCKSSGGIFSGKVAMVEDRLVDIVRGISIMHRGNTRLFIVDVLNESGCHSGNRGHEIGF